MSSEGLRKAQREWQGDPTTGLEVRAAIPSDGEMMNFIAELVLVDNFARFDQGFLLYALQPEEYADRIARGYAAYMLCLDQRPIGFVFGAPREIIECDSGEDVAFSQTLKVVTDYAAQKGVKDFVFIHQCAILPAEQNKGYGEVLIRQFTDRVPGPYFARMLESPLRNPRIRYWCTRGMTKLLEYQEAPSRDYPIFDGVSPEGERPLLTWGIYYLPSGAWAPRCLPTAT